MKKVFSLLLSLVMLVTGLSAGVAFAAVQPTAKDYNTPVAYADNEEDYPTSPYTLKRNSKGAITYCLDKNGKKVTGWAYGYGYYPPYNIEEDNNAVYKIWYYFGEDYKPLKGFQQIGNKKYYFNETGTMVANRPVQVGKRLL